MKLEELLKLLGIDKLDEADQAVIQEKLDVILDTAINEKVDEKVANLLESEKEKLTEEYEVKFDAYKDDITAKFSNFVDGILDEELSLPEEFIEAARVGRIYGELIEQIRLHVAVDADAIDEEAKSLLKEAKEVMLTQKEEINKLTEANLELELDAQKLAGAIYIREKCDGLTEIQKTRVLSILEGIYDRSEIDRKFDIIVETLSIVDESDDEYDGNSNGVEESSITDEKIISESDSPFKQKTSDWVKILRESK